METLTYDDVMFDWAVAELFSPSWGARWTFPLHDTLRNKIRDQGENACTIYEKTYLIERLREYRAQIIALHGPFRSCGFSRQSVSRDALSEFAIVASFNLPSHSLGGLAGDCKEHPHAHDALHYAAAEIAACQRSGKRVHGTPIAIARPAPWHPILIAGYKHAIAFLWDDTPDEIDVHFCR